MAGRFRSGSLEAELFGTQHERPDAALQWRDFGREIGESARFDAALTQLLALESSE